MATLDVIEFTKRLIPITELRKNAGSIFSNLPEIGSVIVTKDGKPIAEITPLKTKKKKTTDRFAASRGAWQGTELEKIDFYSLIIKWRKNGTRKATLNLSK